MARSASSTPLGRTASSQSSGRRYASRRRARRGGRQPHLVLLAKDRVGYGNLCRIVTRAQLDYQDDPQITLSDLAAHARGLIALSGCRRGEIPSLLLNGDRSGAVEAVERYLDVFGQDFWIELEHHLLPDDTALVDALRDVAASTGVGCTLANDVHYANPDEYRLRDVMACIGTRTTLDEWSEVRHANGEYYLKSEEEMRATFGLSDEVFDACVAASEEIADSCNLELLAVTCRPPDFPVPEGETAFSQLYRLCQEGVRRLYHRSHQGEQTTGARAVGDRRDGAGFVFSLRLGHRALLPGRAFAVPGGDQPPIRSWPMCWGLPPWTRLPTICCSSASSTPAIGMPDVDIDFDSRRRDEVIAYIQERNTTEHSAMVANVMTYRSRSAFRDVAKAMGFRRRSSITGWGAQLPRRHAHPRGPGSGGSTRTAPLPAGERRLAGSGEGGASRWKGSAGHCFAAPPYSTALPYSTIPPYRTDLP